MSSAWIAYLIIINTPLVDKIYSPIFPIIIVSIVAYLISAIFLSVFSFSATTILHCFILDEEIKGGRHPASLNEFLEVNNIIAAKKNASIS